MKSDPAPLPAFYPHFHLGVIFYGVFKKVRVYDSFVGGAKDGLRVVIRIFPYLLAIFVAIKAFQASGALISPGRCSTLGLAPSRFPWRRFPSPSSNPFPGAASLGLFTDVVKTTGRIHLPAASRR